MPKALALGVLVVLLVGAVAPLASSQCVMCKTALTDSPEGRAINQTFNRAILLMLVAPYALVGTLMATVFRRPLAAVIVRRLRPGRVRDVLQRTLRPRPAR
ncbi:MAG TPA: hypothetical protein VGK94_11725 [Candidatus Polarisedimenticolia bacterium]